MIIKSLLASAMLLAGEALPAAEPGQCRAVTGTTAMPLLSLYTSEGCSSCPPADRWLSSFAAGHPGIAVLAYHVDYWDYIGWQDRFAAPEFSARQQRLVAAAGTRTVYTPQVMIGGDLQVNWRDREGLRTALARQRRLPAPAAIDLRAQSGTDRVDVALGAALRAGARWRQPQLMLALYSDGMVSRVAAGENAGKLLRHDRVVRALYGPWPLQSGKAFSLKRSLPLPGERGSRIGLVAFIEDAGDGVARQALDLPLQACISHPERPEQRP